MSERLAGHVIPHGRHQMLRVLRLTPENLALAEALRLEGLRDAGVSRGRDFCPMRG